MIKGQILTWDGFDEGPIPDAEPQCIWFKDEQIHNIYISCRGPAEIGSFVVKVEFHPFFYIKLDGDWTDDDIEALFDRMLVKKIDPISGKVKFRYRKATDAHNQQVWLQSNQFVGYERIWRKDLSAGYTGPIPKEFQFLKVTFRNRGAARACSWRVNNNETIAYVNSLGGNKRISLYESALETYIRYMHLHNIQAAGWLEIPASTPKVDGVYFCNEIFPLDVDDIAPFVQMSVDIETYSPDDGVFFDATKIDNYILQIASTITVFGDEKRRKKYIFNLGPCDAFASDSDIILRCFETEAEMLIAWKNLVVDWDPDVIHAYNGWKFDYPALYKRAYITGCLKEFVKMGRLPGRNAYMREKDMSSKAYGDNVWQMLVIPGRLVIDPMIYIQREFKLRLYNLNFVSEYFLSVSLKNNPFRIEQDSPLIQVKHENHGFAVGQYVHFSGIETPEIVAENGVSYYTLGGWTFEQLNGKLHSICRILDENTYEIDMGQLARSSYLAGAGGPKVSVFETKDDISFSKMWEAFRQKDGKTMQTVAEYCVKDTLLPQYIMEQLCILPNLIEMSKCTWVPLEYLFIRGQQVKVHSQISRAAYKAGWAVHVPKHMPKDDIFIDEEEGGYTGGLVLDPFWGYYDCPIAVPDFASLYPITMCDGNYCMTTLVKDTRYDQVEGEIYNRITMEDKKDGTISYATSYKGLLPQVLEHLLENRNIRKAKMANAKTPMEKMVHNGAQLALKISANSIYGFLGVSPSKSVLPGGMPIAKTTTEMGRRGTAATRDYLENPDNFLDIVECTTHFPRDFIYLIKAGRKCFHKTAQSLIETPKHVLDTFLVWTDEEWQPIVGFDYEPATNYVKVCSPVGKTLDYSNLKGRTNAYSVNVPVLLRTAKNAIEMSKKHFSVAVYGDTDSVFILFDSSHLQHKGKVMQTVYCQLVAAYTAYRTTLYLKSLNHFKTFDQQMMNLEYEKTYLSKLLFSKKRYAGIKIEFDPSYVADDEKGIAKTRRDFCLFVKEIMGKLLMVLRTNDIEGTIKTAQRAVDDLMANRVPFEKLIVTKLLKSSYKQREKKEKKKTKRAQKGDFGPHNVFLNDFVEVKLGSSRLQGRVVEKNAVTTFNYEMNVPPIVVAEVDKDGEVAVPERKVRVQYTNIVRRDGAVVTLDKIMDPNTTEAELEAITLAHVRLARKMNLRDPSTAPKSGARVPFVFCKPDNPNVLQYLRAEDPVYAKKHGLKIDPTYYLEKQFKTAIAQLLNTISEGTGDALFAESQFKRSGQLQISSFFKRRK